ncbi:MAG: hypothetical protein ACYCXY_06765 [Acidimicrobiales bacterium]
MSISDTDVPIATAISLGGVVVAGPETTAWTRCCRTAAPLSAQRA